MAIIFFGIVVFKKYDLFGIIIPKLESKTVITTPNLSIFEYNGALPMDLETSDLNELRLYSKERFDEIAEIKTRREILKDEDFLEAPYSLMLGEKGVGKTVLSKQYALRKFPMDEHFSKRVLYVSMDHTPLARYGMYDLAQAFKREGGELIIFDEAHYYKKWDVDLKTIADTVKLKVIVTGSSLLDLKSGVSGLSRRVVEYILHGMSFREYLKITKGIELPKLDLDSILNKHQSISHQIKKAAPVPILSLFHDYLQTGYYVYHLDLSSRKLFFKTLVQSVESSLQKDLILTERISPVSVRKIQSLLYVLSKNVPYTVNYTDLQNILDIPQVKTLKQYLATLEMIGVIRSLHRARLKELKKPEKIYLANTNLYYAFALQNMPDIGSVREIFMLSALTLAGFKVNSAEKGDFLVDGKTVFEIGGKNKTAKQMEGVPNSYIVKDDLEISAHKEVVPLWLFGLL